MTALGSVVVQTVVLLTGLVVVQGDTQVGCVFGGSCVLPCRFQPNSDTILHWVRISGKKVQVHSYYNGQDRLRYQDPLYKGRTSLFHYQISGGDASLRLARVNLQDQGRALARDNETAHTQVGCVFGGSCVLPCRFQTNGDKILHWVKKNGKDVQVHSYYDDEDQLGHQDPLYKGRTSLFHDQISGGNASLGLARVNLQDQGRYQCYASTTHYNQENFVTLTVTAPVARVDIVLGNNTVTCQSRGIYPRPQLTWSVSPRPATVLQNTTEVHEDDQGLYDISGSLRTVYNDTESTYSCSVHNEHSARKATMRLHPPMQSAPRSEVLLPCDASGLDDITWTFNHNQTILRRQAGQEEVVETEWQQHVRNLSESGSLLLYVTSSAQSEGTYRCTLRYADEEEVTDIELKILQDPIEEGSNRTHWITLGVFLAAILSVIIISVIIWRKTTQRKPSIRSSRDAREGTSSPPSGAFRRWILQWMIVDGEMARSSNKSISNENHVPCSNTRTSMSILCYVF
ncbi:unnamed protein product [Boreogadus saida]